MKQQLTAIAMVGALMGTYPCADYLCSSRASE